MRSEPGGHLRSSIGGWQAAHRRSGSIIESMVIDMNEAQVRTLEQVRQVLAGTQAMEFQAAADGEGRYAWIGAVLKRLDYRRLTRKDRGPVLAYLQRLSSYSRAQITRLVSRCDAGRQLVKNYGAPRHPFARLYTPGDVALLIDVNRAMGTLPGPATACVLRRQRDVFGDERFARLGSISVGHLYKLRNSAGYRNQRVLQTKTQPTTNTQIGVRKAPAPECRAGFIRIDSVHQGDLDGAKALYYIHTMDCVTQWQVGASVQSISEAHPHLNHVLRLCRSRHRLWQRPRAGSHSRLSAEADEPAHTRRGPGRPGALQSRRLNGRVLQHLQPAHRGQEPEDAGRGARRGAGCWP